jgi:hypothetical protein
VWNFALIFAWSLAWSVTWSFAWSFVLPFFHLSTCGLDKRINTTIRIRKKEREPGIINIFPAREILVSDIPAGEWGLENR